MSKLGFWGIEFHRKVVESGASLARSLASRFLRRTSTAQTFSGANEILVAFVPPSPTTPHRYQKRRSCARAKVEFKRFKRPSSPTFKIQRLSIAAAHLDARLIALHVESWRPLTQSLHPSSLPLLLLPRLHPNLLQGAAPWSYPQVGENACENQCRVASIASTAATDPEKFQQARAAGRSWCRTCASRRPPRKPVSAGAPAARGAGSRRFLLRRCRLAAAARPIACNGGLRARVSTARRAAWTARLRSLSCCGRAGTVGLAAGARLCAREASGYRLECAQLFSLQCVWSWALLCRGSAGALPKPRLTAACCCSPRDTWLTGSPGTK
jgi:hypothetical protein